MCCSFHLQWTEFHQPGYVTAKQNLNLNFSSIQLESRAKTFRERTPHRELGLHHVLKCRIVWQERMGLVIFIALYLFRGSHIWLLNHQWKEKCFCNLNKDKYSFCEIWNWVLSCCSFSITYSLWGLIYGNIIWYYILWASWNKVWRKYMNSMQMLWQVARLIAPDTSHTTGEN